MLNFSLQVLLDTTLLLYVYPSYQPSGCIHTYTHTVHVQVYVYMYMYQYWYSMVDYVYSNPDYLVATI